METSSCCSPNQKSFDFILFISTVSIIILLLLGFLAPKLGFEFSQLTGVKDSILSMFLDVWWGVVLGFIAVGILGQIPDKFIIALLGPGGTTKGIARATIAGIILDMCNHGILIIASQLYRKGASFGQTVAFLLASPWNSFSFTLILWGLIGLKWTLIFILLSMVIAFITGLITDKIFIAKKILPKNPKQFELDHNFNFRAEATIALKKFRLDSKFLNQFLKEGLSGSQMIIRWILFGILLASLIKGFVPTELFSAYFGVGVLGLGLTILVATILEVCSEGSAPLASQLLLRAAAPGNAFAFLMAGVSTDYTEILILKDTTKSWKLALSLPLISLPQIILISWILNSYGIS